MSEIGGTVVRRATARDAGALARLRAAMRAELHNLEAAEVAAFERKCARYFERELRRRKPNVRAWVACEAERVVAAAALMILPTLPRLGSAGVVDGRIRDVYVAPAYRRRGIARALMALALEAARERGVDRLSLGASTMGRPLYESLGFVTKRDEMVYEPSSRVADGENIREPPAVM